MSIQNNIRRKINVEKALENDPTLRRKNSQLRSAEVRSEYSQVLLLVSQSSTSALGPPGH